jgi:hypothetical protein
MKLLLRLLLSLGHVAVASGYGPSSPSPATIALTIRTSPPVDLPPPLRLTASSPPRSLTSLSSYSSTSTSSSGTSTTRDATTSTTRSPRYPGRSRTLGLLTFDLDDSPFVRNPLSRFYSQYDESYVRTAPWQKNQNPYYVDPNGNPTDEGKSNPFPYLFENMKSYDDYEDVYCPIKGRKSRRE